MGSLRRTSDDLVMVIKRMEVGNAHCRFTVVWRFGIDLAPRSSRYTW